MFRHTNQSKEDKKNTVGNEEDVVLDFFKSKDKKQRVQQFARKQAFIDEKFISQNFLFPHQNKFFNKLSVPSQACKRLSISNLSILNKFWPGLNSGQSVKLLPLGEMPENTNNNDINKKESPLDRINKIKDKVDSENENNKLQTDFYNDQNLFEK